MNTRKWIIVGGILGAFAAGTCVVADDDTPRTTPADSDRVVTTTTTTTDTIVDTEPFPSHQLSIDAFGTYATRDREGSSANRFGGGLGLKYFFIRYFGIGADSYLEEGKWPYRVNGSAIIRLPLADRFSHLAIYGIGGGGREFKDVPQYTWHGGGGVEYKFNRQIGAFADARQVFPDKTPNYTLVRVGMTFGF